MPSHRGVNSLFTALFQSDEQTLEMPFEVSDKILPLDSETCMVTVGMTRQGQAWRELADGDDIKCDVRGTEGQRTRKYSTGLARGRAEASAGALGVGRGC